MDIKYRYELKYHLNIEEMTPLVNKLSEVLPRDPNSKDGSYNVSSLYFDTIDNELYYEKAEGYEKREKIRIRSYNKNTSSINMELKGKHNNGVYKQKVSMTFDEYNRILNNDYDFLLGKGIIGEKFYWKFKTMWIKPKVVVEYERIAFVIPLTDIRITIDYQLKGGICDSLFTNMANVTILPERYVVLEVKGSNDIPRFLKDILKSCNGQLTQNSKYALAMDMIREEELTC